ncbi:MAG: calcium/sodium antiporter [Oscillospiraceae bacterium]|nr:calcium/sodium antiporter [Oscillospiraceae bacterium]
MTDILWVNILLFVVGLALIIKGGDWFVDAATWIAEASGIPKFLIGATIVSVATTLPEIIVSAMAAAEGSTEMAVGNAVGSVSANLGLIMAFSLICIPAVIRRKQFSIKGGLMVAAVAVLLLCCLDGKVTLGEGLICLAIFIAFIYENIRSAKQDTDSSERQPFEKKALAKNIILFAVGAAMLVIGSRLLVDNGTYLAAALGVDERVIAVTMVAIGTSLPELVTAITAVVKKQSSLSVGNILGANIIDITLILPLCAVIGGGALPVSQASYFIDLPVCLAEAAIAVIPTIIRGKFSRVQGVLMAVVYVAYLVYTFAV